MKKLSVWFLAAILLLYAPANASAQPLTEGFADIRGHWAESEINQAVSLGLMSGMISGEGVKIFAPEGTVSRAQLASVAERAFDLDYGQIRFIKAPVVSDYFSDAANDAWYSGSVVLCAINKVLDDTPLLEPDAPISRAELARTIYRSFRAKNVSVPMIMMMPDFSDIGSLTDEDRNAVVFVNNTGIMKGYEHSFRPNDMVKRGELARVLNRCAELLRQNQAISEQAEPSLQLTIEPVKNTNELINVDMSIPQISGLKDAKVQSAVNQQFTADAEKIRADIEAQALAFKQDCEKSGYPFRPHEVCSSCSRYYEDGQILSLYIDYYSYTGGAHGSTERRAYNYDLKTGQNLLLKDLFQPGYDYKTVIDQEIKKDIAAQPEYYFEGDNGFNGIDGQGCYIENGSLVIYFSQYEIAPYAAGIPEFRIPLTYLASGLRMGLLN